MRGLVAEVERPAPAARERVRRPASRQTRQAYLILLPTLGLVFVIVTIPFILAVIQSLTSQDGDFVGLRNFQNALGTSLLYDALRATGVYALIVLPSEFALGLGFALLIHRTVRRAGLRALLYILAIVPLVVPPVAVGVVARLIYAPGYGVLNFILQQVGLIHDEINWLGTPITAMFAVASVDVWQWTPFVYLVLFAGLQTVPQESVEAAQVDGATGWAQFRHIELPYLRPLLLLVLFFRLADVLRVFDHVFVLTGGGPGTTTQFLSQFIYRIAFPFSDLGQASALAGLVMAFLGPLIPGGNRI